MACLVWYLEVPYYLTKKKMKENIYLPEKENMDRAERLFDEFLR